MKYKEKIQHAKMIIQMQSDDCTEDEINEYLLNQDLTQANINAIKHSVVSQNFFAQKKKIRKYMLAGNLEEHLHEFDDIYDDDFEIIQNEIMLEIKRSSEVRIGDLLKQKKTPNEIIAELKNPFFTETEILAVLDGRVADEKDNMRLAWFLAGFGAIGMFLALASGVSIPLVLRIAFVIGIGFLLKDRYF